MYKISKSYLAASVIYRLGDRIFLALDMVEINSDRGFTRYHSSFFGQNLSGGY
ncbi:hypothetical protein [Gloeocapsa sp. PCC 7428]|uniref:hypothetical protein n=1 Tax=Gloeocapsa sp. PCC 7428 TaxID=1173026 RepID=UPI0002D5A78D|nr:hypothetical protein [Gloeocapsa sp. PCC 7428]